MKWPNIIRDMISITVGGFILIHSQLTGIFNLELILVAAALLGGPGIINLVELKKSSNGHSSDSHGLDS
jgi:hypothetical protein